MDHERYPYYSDSLASEARAQRAARLVTAVTHALDSAWVAVRRALPGVSPGRGLSSQRLKESSRP